MHRCATFQHPRWFLCSFATPTSTLTLPPAYHLPSGFHPQPLTFVSIFCRHPASRLGSCHPPSSLPPKIISTHRPLWFMSSTILNTNRCAVLQQNPRALLSFFFRNRDWKVLPTPSYNKAMITIWAWRYCAGMILWDREYHIRRNFRKD